MKRKIWSKVYASAIAKGANVMGGRFVLTLKNVGTPEETAKARCIAQGYSDREKPYLIHDVSALRPASIRLISSLAATLRMHIFLHDVSQAYLQSAEPLSRTIYLKPKQEDLKLFGVSFSEVLELQKSLYGLCDSGDY